MQKTLTKALARAKREYVNSKLTYLDHARMPDDVLIVSYIVESYVIENNKVLCEYHIDILIGDQIISGNVIKSWWKEAEDDTEVERKPTVRMHKRTKRN